MIHAAKCSVFFIDESQRVTLQDIGSVDEIRKWAEKKMPRLQRWELVSQFRCNGSDGYWHGWIIRWKFEILLILIWQTSIMTSEYSIHL